MITEQFEAGELDATMPTAARLSDCHLGGAAHYDVDKVTVSNTHHVVRAVVPDARVIYADNAPESVNRSYDLLTREDATNATIIKADVRDPDSILDHPDTRRLPDFDEPVGLLLFGIFPFVQDDDRPPELMARYRDRLSSGSYVAIGNGSVDEASGAAREMFAAVAESYDETTGPTTLRGRDRFFDGLTIVDPGVVYCPDWRPVNPVDIDDSARPLDYAAVARKP